MTREKEQKKIRGKEKKTYTFSLPSSFSLKLCFSQNDKRGAHAARWYSLSDSVERQPVSSDLHRFNVSSFTNLPWFSRTTSVFSTELRSVWTPQTAASSSCSFTFSSLRIRAQVYQVNRDRFNVESVNWDWIVFIFPFIYFLVAQLFSDVLWDFSHVK